ncbi:MAG: protein phosphatase CheZ [Giesbergeria sp.]|uniref:protein phosphatase CheZ n=1 Tax=Giesbergeria sp. TaxID=2818473 RepID=UPI0026291D8E|nr:protein phosphatase CheZ [Giesbergeria sp.]MDD2608297.1 protein phosphatase CheZ [Giesbergeria sp.]
MDTSNTPPAATSPAAVDVHQRIGILTRQLHDSLNELGYAKKLRSSMSELPDAQSRLSYIARLTGEAAEKVLGRVEQAKAQNDLLAEETRRVTTALVKDPVAAVAKGEVMNFLNDIEKISRTTDEHLTEIMMAQDFHDLTGQVIARVVSLAATIEEQLLQLVIDTAPPGVVAPMPVEPVHEHLAGPVVDPENTPDVVTDQSEVDDLLASLGF